MLSEKYFNMEYGGDTVWTGVFSLTIKFETFHGVIYDRDLYLFKEMQAELKLGFHGVREDKRNIFV